MAEVANEVQDFISGVHVTIKGIEHISEKVTQAAQQSERTATATHEISAMIHQVQSATRQAEHTKQATAELNSLSERLLESARQYQV